MLRQLLENKNIRSLYFESVEVTVVQRRPINKVETYLMTNFQTLLRILQTYSKLYAPGLAEFEKLKADLVGFKKFKFFASIQAKFNEQEKELATIRSKRKELQGKRKSLSTIVSKMESAFIKGNINTAFKMIPQIDSIVKVASKALKPKGQTGFKGNPFAISSAEAFFSGGTRKGLLQSFDKGDMQEAIDKDLSKYKFTYLELPKDKLENFEFIAYFIQTLSDSPKPERLRKDEFHILSDFLYHSKPDYDAFINLVDRYTYSNDKKVLTKILDGIKKYPELYKANEKAKSKIKKVYRGIGFREDERNMVKTTIKLDRKSKFVATSVFKEVAERFAKCMGHLDSKPNCNEGVVLVYKVKPESILLDTSIFRTPYHESEILIDVSKSKIVDSYIVYGEED